MSKKAADWSAMVEEVFYTVDINGGSFTIDTIIGISQSARARINDGNCFRTRKEARAALARVKKALRA